MFSSLELKTSCLSSCFILKLPSTFIHNSFQRNISYLSRSSSLHEFLISSTTPNIPSPYIYIPIYIPVSNSHPPFSRKQGGERKKKKRRKRKLIQRGTVTRTKASSSSSSPLYKGPDSTRCEKKRRCRKREGYGSYGDDGEQFRKVSPQIFHGPHPDPHKSLANV